ncbi:sulfite:cytochrome C oxidoreductase subunit B [Sulfurimonas aquatica]|uniref:Sulfite:cytochrome C oxidoreductase subunit B n=1 Tax=Sulfurimonas aquatica TaxID=2672570 RepID=A0A975GCF0_9BACT|nr:sulfite:cytochrome C oxidoreductase subunit B [Sulfurimonas aquatica]QSZ41646.1 sulfite:cytochrome C oxidoreductase subunit B [Sulfurimonas aquatica]
MSKIVLLVMLAFGSLFAQVDSEIEVPYISYEIKMGEGFDTVQAQCLMCHSFGYIINQGPQSKDFWAKKTKKMITHFKMPLEEGSEDFNTIVKYLYKHYGNGKLK